MALDRTALTATAAIKRRPSVAAIVQRNAAPAARAPARALQERLGNRATQAYVARSVAASAKEGTSPSSTSPAVSKKNDPAALKAEQTQKAAKPAAPAEKEKEKEKKPAEKGEAGEKAAAPSPRQAIAPAVHAVQERATHAKKHADKGVLVGSAQAAAMDPKVEAARDASVSTVQSLDDAKTAKVRRDKFKDDLSAAIKAATPEPKTKDQAEEVVQTGGKKASN